VSAYLGRVTIETIRALLAARYQVDRELGRGGMGVVYLARDLALDRLVALKVLPPALAVAADVRERFLREARTAAQLSHPNIVPIHHAEAVEGIAYFAMGYVDGESLGDRLRARGTLPVAEAVRYLREAAWALAYAHARGVIHRDVKPENLLLERGTGRVLVTDFGIARDATRADNLTRTGHVLGTVHYMSPEQVAGEPLDGRSDLYALGVVGYQLLSGRLPFDGEVATAVLVAHATRPAPSLASVAPDVPRAVAAVIDRCLAKDPEARPATGEALADALGAALAQAEVAAGSAPAGGIVLTETQAAALWQRAAQLQADAMHRLERRDIAPALTEAGAARGATPADGYRLEHVQAAALEAGISQQFVSLALAEVRGAAPAGAGAVAGEGRALVGWQDRHSTQFLGTTERSLAVTRIIAAPPAKVLAAIGQVLPQGPFDLSLREVVGGHPLDGGVMVFAFPGERSVIGVSGGLNLTWYGTRQQLEAATCQLTLREAPGLPGASELTMYVDLRPGVRRNVNAAAWLSGVFGSLAGGIGGAIGVKTLAALGALGVVGAGVGAAGAVALGTIALYRGSYRNALRRAQEEMTRALDAVGNSLRAEDVFGPRHQLPAAPRTAPGAGGSG